MQENVFGLIGSLSLSFLAALSVGAAESEVAALQTPFIRMTVSRQTGAYEIHDKAGGVTWRSNPYHARFGEVSLKVDGNTRRVDLDRCEIREERIDQPNSSPALELTFRPLGGDAPPLRVRVIAGSDQKTLNFSYGAPESLGVESVRLLDDALWVTDEEKGALVVPVREGLLIPAESGLQFTHRFDTYAYEGSHMEMLGVLKSGAAALVTWTDPYAAAEVRSVLTNAPTIQANQLLSPSLTLRNSAKAFRVQFLGRGDHVTIGQAYREVAKERGWFVPWEQKLVGHAERAKLFGAINFKLWSTLDRRMNEASTQEERVRVNWTFDEAGEVAAHLKEDLKLDKVLFIMGGWIHRGYDNQHPDILPTAPECGGDAAFTACARRVRDLGYLFCLHDNYQDIYKDSPSWDEALVMKNRDGTLSRGGHWAGGLAYLTCSQKAVDLAQRPQNLAAVKKLSEADAYFIDTTYAAGLQECFDPKHPLTRSDDMKWKQAISDYARDVFGIFGSECGREWAIPHSDFFEGLTGVSGHYYHDQAWMKKVGGVVLPLFEIVYRDTIAMYGKYGYDVSQSADYVLYHISIGRPLNYHNVPPHLYWKQSDRTNEVPAAADPARDRAVFTRAHHGWAEGMHILDRFVKNTAEVLSPLNEITAQLPMTGHEFLTSDRRVQRTVFGRGPAALEAVVNASTNDFRVEPRSDRTEVVLAPYGFVVESPTFVAFNALEYGGVKYAAPTLFTLRSVDGKPISTSKRVRVFHGFGDDRVNVGERVETVARESVIER